jgi:hypothetical protein
MASIDYSENFSPIIFIAYQIRRLSGGLSPFGRKED